MARSNAFRLARLLGPDTTIQADKIATDAVGGGVTTYATAAALPLSGNTSGDQAFVSETGRLYIFTGTGWYNIALINTNPTITSGANASYDLNPNGTPTIVTLEANDPEGVPITWSYAVTTGSLTNGGGNTATVTQADNEFTITPSTTEAHVGAFEITFTASDGVNLATSASTFTLTFGIAATGGTITTYSSGGINYKVHTFTSSGTFIVTSGDGNVEYLIVGGGGAAGSTPPGDNRGGGGGAGGFVTGSTSVALAVGAYSVVVGSGGNAQADTTGANGSPSSFNNIIALGGGGGGGGGAPGQAGGSGGGGGAIGSQANFSGGAATQPGSTSGGLGNNGGLGGTDSSTYRFGGAGGGAGQVGQSATVPAAPPLLGGDGAQSDITGTTVFYAGGGGGGGSGTAAGGAGGGGTGFASGSPGGAGTANTGGGGGGVGINQMLGGSGGSGIVIIRYAVA